MLQVGDCVRHIHSGGLRCGSGVYQHAYIVQKNPLVLISQDGDMLWRCTIKERDLVFIREAKFSEMLKPMKRLQAEQETQSPDESEEPGAFRKRVEALKLGAEFSAYYHLGFGTAKKMALEIAIEADERIAKLEATLSSVEPEQKGN